MILEPNELDTSSAGPADHEAAAEDLAFIQYTSGSTGPAARRGAHPRQRGAHVQFMSEAAAAHARRRVVSWLPLYHDMGLIGCAFTPPLTAAPLRLLPPDLKNPRAVARAGHPGEGDLHGVARLRLPQLRAQHAATPPGSTSRRLKPALSGAEPVRPRTIEAFERKFGAQT